MGTSPKQEYEEHPFLSLIPAVGAPLSHPLSHCKKPTYLESRELSE